MLFGNNIIVIIWEFNLRQNNRINNRIIGIFKGFYNLSLQKDL